MVGHNNHPALWRDMFDILIAGDKVNFKMAEHLIDKLEILHRRVFDQKLIYTVFTDKFL